MKVDESENEKVLISHSQTIMDAASEETEAETLHMDSNIIFYIAGFISHSLKKKVKYQECSNILGSNEEITIPMAVDIPEDCKYFLNSINRGGLIKPSDIIFLSCIASWRVYQMIMDNDDSKAYFLACKSQRLVFVKCLFIYIENNDSYSGLFRTTCIL